MPPLYRVHADRLEPVKLLDFIAVERPVQYPKTWFDNNPGLKPPVAIVSNTENNINNIESTVRDQFNRGTLDVKIAVAFLYGTFVRKPATLNEDWESFGRVIGNRGKAITLANIMDFKATESLPPLIEGPPLGENDRIRFVIAICCVYRLAQIKGPGEKQQMMSRMRAALKRTPGIDINIEAGCLSDLEWLSYAPYVNIIACIDMFLNEFPTHDYSVARIGTIPSRLKDCTVYTASKDILALLGLSSVELAEWIWLPNCAKQFAAVVREDQEMDQPRSYAMYFMEMHLSNRSPYSAGANAALHFFFHSIGVSAGFDRSMNAKMAGRPEMNVILNNVLVLSYVLCTGPADELEKDMKESDSQAVPKSQNAVEWREYISRHYGLYCANLPYFIKHSVYTRWLENRSCRHGTIGKELYELAQSKLRE